MFRRPSGGMGFSLNRLVTNMFPNFASDNPERDASLTTAEMDMLWQHQVSGAEAAGRSAMTLDEKSALAAGITTSEKISTQIHKELVKNGIIDAASPLGIETSRVTNKFAHQLSFISVAAQRKVVGMLFFWEQEVIRRRLLDDEAAELQTALDSTSAAATGATTTPPPTRSMDDPKHELNIRLESVRMRKEMRPSERLQDTGAGGEPVSAPPLPEYSR